MTATSSAPVASATDDLLTADGALARLGTIKTRRISDVLGLEISGADLRRADAGSITAIKRLFTQHHLLVIRNQDLNDAELELFAAQFGKFPLQVFVQPDGTVFPNIHQITNLDASGKPSRTAYNRANLHWHTDHAFKKQPALLTMLETVEIPPRGGDTEFANTELAWDALSDTLKQEIAGLRAEHDYEWFRRTVVERPALPEELALAPTVTHPIVRTHPETGRKCLYLGMYAARVVGMDEQKGRALLESLTAHATQPRFVHRLVWQKGDLVIWDNTRLLHRAIPNYEADLHRRVLRRAVIEGPVPV
jgi:alpha-ketoglutarate-dependent taurine dioxygenase